MTAPIGHLFVYGTLMTGGSQAHLAGPGARAAAAVRGKLFALPAGYPALVLDGEGGSVHGELVALDDPRRLALLDRYEGVDDGLFRRVEVQAVASLRAVRAWAWVMDDPTVHRGRPLPSGRWDPSWRRTRR